MQILVIDHNMEQARFFTNLIEAAGHGWSTTSNTTITPQVIERIDACIVSADLPRLGLLAVLRQLEHYGSLRGRTIPTLVHAEKATYDHYPIRFELWEIHKLFAFASYRRRSDLTRTELEEFVAQTEWPPT